MYRNKRVLDHARHVEECSFCGRTPEPGSIVAAHSNQGRHGKAGHLKAADCFIAYLCMDCHHAVDAGRVSQDVAVFLWETAHARSIPLFQHLLDDEGKRLLGIE